MTTIAYDHKAGFIACDGRSTSGSTITSDIHKKWVEADGKVWFYTGSVADVDRFIKYTEHGDMEPPRWPIECTAILVESGVVYIVGVSPSGEPWRERLECSRVIGSGCDFALSAMDFGKSAGEAVAYAATRDSGTGGKVSVFDVAEMRFIQ